MKHPFVFLSVFLLFLCAPTLVWVQSANTQTVVELTNPIGGSEADKQGITDWGEILGTTIQYGMGILGSATLAVFLYGGFLWLTSRGNSEKVKAGLDAMIYAALGICIIFGSYAILSTIFKGLTQTP